MCFSSQPKKSKLDNNIKTDISFWEKSPSKLISAQAIDMNGYYTGDNTR